MQRVRDIQLDCLADDIPIAEQMVEWSEEKLRAYFESGGATPI